MTFVPIYSLSHQHDIHDSARHQEALVVPSIGDTAGDFHVEEGVHDQEGDPRHVGEEDHHLAHVEVVLVHQQEYGEDEASEDHVLPHTISFELPLHIVSSTP